MTSATPACAREAGGKYLLIWPFLRLTDPFNLGNARGAVVSVIAYKSDYLAAQDELKVIDATARDKKCKTPENWSSTSAIR